MSPPPLFSLAKQTTTCRNLAADARRDKVRPQARRAHTAGGRGMYSRRPAALTRPEAGIRYGRRPAALARTHAGIRYGRRLAALARPHAGAMYSRRPAALTLPHGGRPEAGIRCGRSSYPASIVFLRAKHAFRPKYAFGEKIKGTAARTCEQSMIPSYPASIVCDNDAEYIIAFAVSLIWRFVFSTRPENDDVYTEFTTGFQTKVCIRREN